MLDIPWLVYLEMLGIHPVKGYLLETFNSIEVKHARNTMIVQAASEPLYRVTYCTQNDVANQVVQAAKCIGLMLFTVNDNEY